mmetsp:Transcript_2795/g.6744  ORF Transcript_2795/g.6744 Transcript_2795/m.6744 type:complete len:188 (-) Transcript_2795:12-575(-)
MGVFHMHVPISTSWDCLPRLKPEVERRVVALDPGVRTFLTFYSDNDVGAYASGALGFAQVFRELEKCDAKVSALANRELSHRARADLHKSKHRSIERVRNLVDEVHKKVANDLCAHYDTILLASKVVMRGKELAVVTEEYTTQCCGRCGNLNKKVGGAKVYKCAECGFQCGRDENAARNIFLKYLKG